MQVYNYSRPIYEKTKSVIVCVCVCVCVCVWVGGCVWVVWYRSLILSKNSTEQVKYDNDAKTQVTHVHTAKTPYRKYQKEIRNVITTSLPTNTTDRTNALSSMTKHSTSNGLGVVEHVEGTDVPTEQQAYLIEDRGWLLNKFLRRK